MKTKAILIVIILVLAGTVGFSQSFINLNFEQANVSGYSPGSSSVPVTAAFPGWQAYYGTSETSDVWYDNTSLGGNMIALWDTNSEGYFPIAGQYSAALFGSASLFGGSGVTASISQTGTVPIGTVSLTLDIGGSGAFSVSLGGQTLNLTALSEGSTPDYSYTEYGADISAFAGLANQQLTITSLADGDPNEIIVDNIQFSTSPVPEPGTLTLSVTGGLLLARWWQKRFLA